MLRTPIVDLLNATEPMPEVRLGGWVRTRRDAKGFTFLELNDGSCLGNIQCIVDEGTPAWDKLEGINTGACVAVTGELVESPGKGQKWEIRAREMTVFGLADPETFPLQKKRHSDEFLRTIAASARPEPTSTAPRPHRSEPHRPCTTISANRVSSTCIPPF